MKSRNPRASFATVHESAVGTKLPFLDVRHLVATEGKPDVGERAGFGRD